ncbi:MAG: TonB-dependent receptor [Bacteroidales bacterium]|jgi:TonB-linked SusC/RagA family outer membrane protein|nr:TonB-dependent receptor [Bacteroidales bacterium]
MKQTNLFKKLALLCFLTLLFISAGFAQNRHLTGVVLDTKSEPIPFASVYLPGTTTGVTTDIDGKFSLSVPANAIVFEVSFTGYQKKTVTIGNQSSFSVVLAEEATALDEVVVIGYGTQKKRDLTGAVASISAKDIVAKPVASIGEALAGRMAGVQVTTAEGSPDAEIAIRVRGGGSITQDNSPLYIVDGFPVNSISDVSPNEIASIDVLKDASSTAIYGARGANGVVIITTKSGETGKVTVNYSGYVGVKKIAKQLKTLDPYDFALLQYELALLKSNATDPNAAAYEQYLGTWEDIDMYKEQTGNDWQDITFGRTGYTSNHSLNISGGVDVLKYSFNYNRYDEKAIMYGSNFSRDNIALKLNSKPYKRLTLDLSVRWSQTRIKGGGMNDGGDEKGSATEGRLRNAIIYTPIPIQGTISADDDDRASNLFDPITSLKDNDKNQVRNRLNLNGAVSWEIISNLKLRAEIGFDQYRDEQARFWGKTTYAVINGTGLPMVEFARRNRQSIRNANTLSYSFAKILPKDHNLSLLAGFEIMSTSNNILTSTVNNMFEDFGLQEAMNFNFGTATEYLVNNYYSPDDRLLSAFGRLNYDYKGRYLFSATFRADGSSKFAKGNRWGYFPSASAAWRISAEPWMKATENWLYDLKLRASYGTAGNNNIPSGSIVQSINSGFAGASGIIWLSLDGSNYLAVSKTYANPNLKWETTITRNLGLDVAFLKGKINLALDAYLNTTNDLLILFPMAGFGYDNQYQNIGKTQNKGFEFTANYIALDKKNYGLSFSWNIGFNKNKILSLGDMASYTTKTNWGGTGSGGTYDDYLVAVGYSVGQMWGYQSDGRYEVSDFEGFDASTGKWILKAGVVDCSGVTGSLRPGAIKLKDLDNDGKITTDNKDKTVIGNANPLFTGGFNINANIWGFDIGLNFNYSYGNDVYNANKIEYTQSMKYTMRNMIDIMETGSRWTNLDPTTGMLVNDPAQLEAMNANTTMWSPYAPSNYVFSDWAVEDGSFLRLNTVTLGYTIPKHLTMKAKIQNVRIYCSAYNLWLLTKYTGFDPEVNTRRSTPLTPGVDFSAYPRSKSVVFGLNITF